MKGSRFKLNQNHAPIHEALETFRRMRVVPFDVPGHKRGRGNPELTEFLGQKCVGVDVNSMKPLDNLCHPVSVIREAEELAADAFGAAHAFLMVGGTTSSVQTMVLTACKRGDEIILPRNVHRSVLNALVLCGAIPVYVNPEVDQRLGISLGMQREQVAKAIKEHPKAVAVLVNNPTYYGICSDLRAIVKMAHEAGMMCLVDEAHGTHFYFGGGLPVSAMEAGADMASVSMHKSGGSLTQSSLLLTGPDVHAGYVRQIINLTQTTSGSYLLMSSLDISRRNLAQRGRQIFHQVARIMSFLHPENYADSTALQTSNSIMAIGSGGLFGKGFGSNTISNVSASDVNLVSENQTDFIFSVIGEEFGFVGCVVLIIVFACLVYQCMNVAKKSGNLIGTYVAVGVACYMGFQSFINIAVATGTMPNTGQPLPFISYGLSSLMSASIAIGMVLNIYLQRKRH